MTGFCMQAHPFIRTRAEIPKLSHLYLHDQRQPEVTTIAVGNIHQRKSQKIRLIIDIRSKALESFQKTSEMRQNR